VKWITALPIAMIAAWMATRTEGPWSFVRVLGLVLILIGLGMTTVARIQFEREYSKNAGLVTTGIYGLFRHPIYMFSGIAFAGLLLYLNEPLGVLGLLPIQFVLFYLARREEQQLEALCGQQYRQYKQQTWF
jgi:protein-S-isoprenylcysteine O-methyltransferase Ste14